MPPVKTRSGYQKIEPYPLNQFPSSVIEGLAKQAVYWKAVGTADLTGDRFSKMFAISIDGERYKKPLGIADVVWDSCCWSVKTVKSNSPHKAAKVRLISGRNSPTYSSGITDPYENLQLTGNSVLEVYNSRINEAYDQHSDVRLLVFVRNMFLQEFTIYERVLAPIPINNYQWIKNKNNNLEGYEGKRHAFTWQPHGSQFTILEKIPQSATKFLISKRPKSLQVHDVLKAVGYKSNWVEVDQ